MTRLLIPTRNRPTALRNLFRYLAHFYPATPVIVADGSADPHQQRNRDVVEEFQQHVAVDYRPYPADLPYFDRLLDVVRAERDEFLIIGADDDYPVIETLQEGEAHLRRHPDFVTATGMRVILRLTSPSHLESKAGIARSVVAAAPLGRARRFAAWPFQTTYAVTRRDILLERCKRASKLFVIGFYDFTVGIHDCMYGKIHAVPDIAFFSTHNYSHSYLRPDDRLVYLRKSDEVLQIVEQFRRDLVQYGGLDIEDAKFRSEQLIKLRIAELSGRHPHMMRGFEQHPMFTSADVQKQFDIFEGLFEENSTVRTRYYDKLKFVVSALQANAESNDNAGEKKTFETPEGQAAWSGEPKSSDSAAAG